MAHWNRSKDHLDVSALTNAVMTLTGTSGFGSDSFELSAPKDQFTDESNSIEKLTSELSSVVFLRRGKPLKEELAGKNIDEVHLSDDGQAARLE